MSDILTRSESRIATDKVNAAGVNVRSLVLIILAAIALAVLAFAAHSIPYFDFDLAITRAVQSIHAPWFDTFMPAVGWAGYPPQIYIETVVLLLLLWFVGMHWEAVTLLVANVGIAALGMGLKLLVARPRPSPNLVYVQNPSLQGGGLSFPAGHVQGTVVVLGFFIYLIWKLPHRKWWQTALLIFMVLIVALIGLSRIFVGEHWFSDVVGGYLLGIIGLWLTIRLYEWGESKYGRRKETAA